MAQIQLGMLMTGTEECCFVQWTPNELQYVMIPRFDGWLESIQPRLDDFFEELQDNMDDPEYVEALTGRADDEWVFATNRFKKAAADMQAAKEALDYAREALIEEAGPAGGHGCGVKVSAVVRKGNINYKAIPELKGVDLEQYRGKESTFFTVKETKAS